jgi:hypothetical protein
VTGVSFRTEGLTSKQVELALQMIPDLVKIGFLVNVASGVIIDRQELESTCQRLGIKAVPAEVRSSWVARATTRCQNAPLIQLSGDSTHTGSPGRFLRPFPCPPRGGFFICLIQSPHRRAQGLRAEYLIRGLAPTDL